MDTSQTRFTVKDWLQGNIKTWWSENRLPIESGLVVHCMINEYNDSGELILSRREFKEIVKLQTHAFNKMADVKCILERHLFDTRISNSLDQSKSISDKLNRLDREIKQLNPDVMERVINGEINVVGLGGPTVEVIDRLYDDRFSLSDEQIQEFISIWPENPELEGRYKLLLIENLENKLSEVQETRNGKVQGLPERMEIFKKAKSIRDNGGGEEYTRDEISNWLKSLGLDEKEVKKRYDIGLSDFRAFNKLVRKWV